MYVCVYICIGGSINCLSIYLSTYHLFIYLPIYLSIYYHLSSSSLSSSVYHFSAYITYSPPFPSGTSCLSALSLSHPMLNFLPTENVPIPLIYSGCPWFPELSFQMPISVLWTHLSVTLRDVGTLAKSPLQWPFHSFLPPTEASSSGTLGSHTHILGFPHVNCVWVLSLSSVLLGQGTMGAGWAHPLLALPAPKITAVAQVPSDTFNPACWFLTPLELEIRGFEIPCATWKTLLLLGGPYLPLQWRYEHLHVTLSLKSLLIFHQVLWHLLP